MSVAHTASVLVLNGPAAVGKTTVGREIASAAGGGGACVHGDDLVRFVVREPGGQPEGGSGASSGKGDIGHALGAAVTNVFLESGYELVVFEYVFTSGDALQSFTEAIHPGIPLCIVTLWAPMATVQNREIGRPYSQRLGTRVFESWQAMSENLEQLGTVVDADHALDEVVEAVKGQLDACLRAH